MAHDAGRDFAADVDHLRDILWICAKRATADNGGLSLVQSAQRPLNDWPREFLAHVDVVNRERRRTPVNGTSPDESAAIDEATRDRPRADLEAQHRAFMADYRATGCR
jgi:hypothetical protein